METLNRDQTHPNTEFISRLGYREAQAPSRLHCLRNGEALELIVHFFENRNSDKVIYYTEAIDMQTGRTRHTATFQFSRNNDHIALHKFCLYTLFFDEELEELFNEQNKFNPPVHLNAAKAESFLNWVRYFWNTQSFNEKYKMLGGLNSKNDLLKD